MQDMSLSKFYLKRNNIMTLTATQVLQCKKHMGVIPTSTVIDSMIEALEDASTKETELTTAIALCETRYSALNTSVTNGDDLTEGGGAKFNHSAEIRRRKQWYMEAVGDLSRLLGIDLTDGVPSGFYGFKV